MTTSWKALRAICFGCLLGATAFSSQGQEIIWNVGRNDNTQSTSGDGGGEAATFWQENGGQNALPGNPANNEANGQSDDDYYFAGVYDNIIAANGDYFPVGNVEFNEEGAERAFVASDTFLRYHFNLPADLLPTNLLTVEFDMVSIHTAGTDPRWGVEVYFNNVKVQEEILIRPPQIGTMYKTRQFTVEEVGGQVGPGFDNIVTLKGIPYNTAGGGDWMGLDYIQLNKEAASIPLPVFPIQIGKDDNTHAAGDGGGINATFVRESGSPNALPGNPANPETDGAADDDYYLGGSYTTVIAGNGAYTPVGIVGRNEEAFERAFVPGDTDRRIHFNLPNTMKPADRMAVTFEPMDLENASATVTDPRFGVEIWVNGVQVMTERVVRPADLNKAIQTAPFTLAQVNAQVGSGVDNIILLKGIPHNDTGGGGWMGIDYVKVDPIAAPPPPPILPWAVGINDNQQPALNGGADNATFVQENGVVNPLPGNPLSPETDLLADNDYYLAGVYNTVIAGNGTYTPLGIVSLHEEAFERALTPGDNEQRIHFNLPAWVTPTTLLSIEVDPFNIDDSTVDPRMGLEVYVNNVKVLNEVIVTPATVGQMITVPPFTAGSANIQSGEGFDNIVTLKGISYAGPGATEGGANWMGLDHIQMNPVLPPPFPWTVGRNDNAQPSGNGGGANATFVQETGGISPLPGTQFSVERNQQADNDYYFAGEYTTVIPEFTALYGDYTPIGPVVVNEETFERAFAAGDNAMRIHFNIPAGTPLTNRYVLSFDALSLHTGDTIPNPRYGAELIFNDVVVNPEVVIKPADLGRRIISEPFTLESVHAQVGPGFDNVVTLRGINYNNAVDEFGNPDGGGNWMGIDYIALDALPSPSALPIQIGSDDNTHLRTGNGGGPNASFMQENGVQNILPGNPSNAETDGQSDNDYYFAGVYTNVIPNVETVYGGYTPVGIVTQNEESAERAFVPSETELRYHFNLPETLKPTNRLTVTFDPFNFDDRATATNPRWGIEVLFNGHVVGEMRTVTVADVDTDITTAPFTLESVGALTGLGNDNIVSLRGTAFNGDGGGDWMGIDYVKIDLEQAQPLQLAMPVFNKTAGTITIDWTGPGTPNLQWAPTVSGPWTTITAPAKPYVENVVTTENRFYRLIQ